MILPAKGTCPHCGAELPPVDDAFCNTCFEPLNEPPETPRTEEEKRAFREAAEKRAKESKGA